MFTQFWLPSNVLHVALPSFLVTDQRLQIVHAELWSNFRKAAQGSVQRLSLPLPFR